MRTQAQFTWPAALGRSGSRGQRIPEVIGESRLVIYGHGSRSRRPLPPEFLPQSLLLQGFDGKDLEEPPGGVGIVGQPERFASGPVDILHGFLIIHDQDGRGDRIENLVC